MSGWSWRALVVDAAASLALIYGSFWAYEGSNVIALMLAGMHPELVVQGILPLGVVANASLPEGPALKLLQMGITGGLFLFPFRRLWEWGRPMTRVSVTIVASCILSSFIWEMLGPWSVLPAWASPAVFLTLTTASASLVTVVTASSRPPSLRAVSRAAV